MRSSLSGIIISASSDIGAAIGGRWLANGWKLFGTYRTRSDEIDDLTNRGAQFIHCDLSDGDSLRTACGSLRGLCPRWDLLAICPGRMEPIGPFLACDAREWEESVIVNFTRQALALHELLPARNIDSGNGPLVIFFAGGGTNSAPPNYSAYTVSKIALIKMCELLDAEIPDTRFVIIGPGWVRTKIHESTLRAGAMAGGNYERTAMNLEAGHWTPMERVLECCDWLVNAPRESIGGRNFSVAYDRWGTEALERRLAEDSNMYKLRRSGNSGDKDQSK